MIILLNLQSAILTGGSLNQSSAELDKFASGMVSSPSPLQRRGSSRLTSPVQVAQVGIVTPHDAGKRSTSDYEFYASEVKGDGSRQPGWNIGGEGSAPKEPALDTEATVARDTFVGMLETVSRTKDSIGRATRQAMDCAKHRMADQVFNTVLASA